MDPEIAPLRIYLMKESYTHKPGYTHVVVSMWEMEALRIELQTKVRKGSLLGPPSLLVELLLLLLVH